VVVAVVAGWASTAWRLAFAPEADETLLRDMLRGIEFTLPAVVGVMYWGFIRIEEGRDINIWMRPIAHISWAPARLLWFCCVVADLAAAVGLTVADIATNMWLYAAYHGSLLAVGYILATRKRPPAQMRQRVPAGAKRGVA
jgi:hypothetical protein